MEHEIKADGTRCNGACLKSKSRTLTMKDFTLTELATTAAEKHNGKCNVGQRRRVKVCLKTGIFLAFLGRGPRAFCFGNISVF